METTTTPTTVENESTSEARALMVQRAAETRRVRAYLEALNTIKRGNRRLGPRLTQEQIQEKIARYKQEAAQEPDPLKALLLLQRARNFENWTEVLDDVGLPHLKEMEDSFVEVALAFSKRHGVEYKTWRDAKVPADVLKRARIRRTRTDKPKSTPAQ